MAWLGLIVVFVLLLALDFFIFAQKGVPKRSKTAKETAFLVSVALAFSGVIYVLYSKGLVENPNQLQASQATMKYLSGYLIELSLSMDNLFVMAIIFKSYKIPIQYQHRVLFWGILGAIVFRLVMISAGVVLMSQISWMTYVFGAFLLFTAIKMMVSKDDDPHIKKESRLEKWLRVSPDLKEGKFTFKENGLRYFTPLFMALIMIELTDLLFALDSIPAILAITTDPYIVFSSNIFAILGLRSMYFFLADMMERFVYLKQSVFAILIFVSIKLLTHEFIHLPEWLSLSVIVLCMGMGIYLSYRKENAKAA
jgi:tellurite resistance protein TerC